MSSLERAGQLPIEPPHGHFPLGVVASHLFILRPADGGDRLLFRRADALTRIVAIDRLSGQERSRGQRAGEREKACAMAALHGGSESPGSGNVTPLRRRAQPIWIGEVDRLSGRRTAEA